MYHKLFLQASVVELVDTPDLGSGAAMRGGSSPFTRTIFIEKIYQQVLNNQAGTKRKSCE